MTDLVSHSSSVGRLWIHLRIKVKYCHKIFRFPDIKRRCEQLLWEAINQLGIRCKELGIDEDHAHFVLDAGLHPLPNIVKKLKGYTAKTLLREYPWLKRKYFWGSGMWNPAYYFDSLGSDIENMATYVRAQGQVNSNSTGLMRWLHVTGG